MPDREAAKTMAELAARLPVALARRRRLPEEIETQAAALEAAEAAALEAAEAEAPGRM